MKYIYEVIGIINQLFSILGFNDEKFNSKFMADKVSIVNSSSEHLEIIGIINNLYEEFIIIRNKIIIPVPINIVFLI